MQEHLAAVSQWARSLDQSDFRLITLVATIFTLVFFALFLQGLRRHRIIADTPTARLRSAAQGYAEIKGWAEAFEGHPLLSPLTHSACCWYEYRIEREDRDGDGDTSWTTVASGRSGRPLMVHDETHRALIEPRGGDVVTRHREQWYDRKGGLNIDIGPVELGSGRRHRYTEKRIHDGEPVYALGNLRTLDEGAMADYFTPLMKDEPAGPLVEAARNQARRSEPMHVLEKHRDRRRPFIISTDGEGDLIKRYRRQAAIFFVLFWFPFLALALVLLGRLG